MAKAFLRSVAEYILENHKDKLENLCIVLPNKRGALFLKSHLSQVFEKTIWLPRIISAEELITEFSGLQQLEEIDLICHLYESYKHCYGPAAESFDSFAKWGQLILQDFNEIDRYLADSEQLYENLKDIKVIENWSLGKDELSEYQINYLRFMKSLGNIYKHFSAFLLSNGWAYQGLAYKQAVANLSTSPFPGTFHKILFCGFNALNAAELKIFHTLFLQNKAEFLWDADSYYLDDKNQEAGLFLRNNLESFGQRTPVFVENNLVQKKNIRILSVPRQIGQAQVVKQILQRYIDEGIALDKVAVVLANEKLLWPVLQQLPPSVQHLNITMEYPLRYSSSYSFIELLIQIQLNFVKQKRTQKTIYHHDFNAIVKHPLFHNYLQACELSVDLHFIVKQLTNRNLSFLSQQTISTLFGDNYVSLKSFFEPASTVRLFCDHLLTLLSTLELFFSLNFKDGQHGLELEFLRSFSRNFNRLRELLVKYPHFNDMQSFKQLFSQVLGNSSVPFIGEPLKGLQIMGVLETRTLDFEYIILVNANEGILPSGKTINSFIPNDLKRAFGLPLYIEKDAIYAYHFYRLLQKSTEIVITYDSETDTFGKGEKSRFITQLQLELKTRCPQITITEEVASYPEFPPELNNVITIEKNKEVLSSVLKKAMSNEVFGGLSPSGLITYKDCALKFYFRYGAQLKEAREVEESAEANTFGSILHLALEQLYKPHTGKVIDADTLTEIRARMGETVNTCFISFFDNHPPQGKSLLQLEVIKVYVNKLVQSDQNFVQTLKNENAFLTLLGLEEEYSAPIEVVIGSENVKLYLKGKIDRIDAVAGRVRVIDYKNSVQTDDKFVFDGFESLFRDTKYNKQLQLIIYAWLLFKNEKAEAAQIQACIIPFKVFSEKPKYILGSDKKPLLLSEAFFNEFENELAIFIGSIFNENTSFIQTDDEEAHAFCPYKTICHLGIQRS